MDAEDIVFDLQVVYEGFLQLLQLNECPWIRDRLSAGDYTSVFFFVSRVLYGGNGPVPGEKRMVHRILNDANIVRSNHTYL